MPLWIPTQLRRFPAVYPAGLNPGERHSSGSVNNSGSANASRSGACTANDNASALQVWVRGHSDGRIQAWTEDFADHHGPLAENYLAGWMAGSRS